MALQQISERAFLEVELARLNATQKHGPLKPGADRWMRLLGEEWEEVQDELALMQVSVDGLDETNNREIQADCRKATIAELAQLAQLCIGVIELLQAEEAIHGS